MEQVGRQRDDLPAIELVDESVDHDVPEGAAAEVGVASRGRSWRMLGAAVVFLVGAGAVLSSMRDDGGPDDAVAAPSTTTSVTPTSEAVAPAGGGGEYLSGRPTPVFAASVDGSLLIGGGESGWRQVDLATGWVAERPELDGVAPESIVALDDAVVYLKQRFSAPWLLPLPPSGPSAAPTTPRPFISTSSELGQEHVEYIGLLSAGTGDRLWVLTTQRSGRDAELQATLMDAEGRRLDDPFPIPALPVAGTRAGVVFNAGGHGFLVNGNFTTDLGDGEVYAAAASTVARVGCNENAQCHQQVVDLRDPVGSSRRGPMPTAAAATGSVTMAVTDHGALAALPIRLRPSLLAPTPTGLTTSLYLSLPDGSRTRVVVDNARAGPVWLDDGGGVLMLTGNGLVRYPDVEQSRSSRPVPGLLTGDASALIHVPRASTEHAGGAVPTYDLDLPGATLTEESTSTPTGTPVAVWASEETYLSLAVRPGAADAYGGGRFGEGPVMPVDWLSETQGEAWMSVPRHEPTAHLRWARATGDLWMLDAYWYHDMPPAAEREAALRVWAQGISADALEGSGYSLATSQMRTIGFDPGGPTRARARVWSYAGEEIVVFVIEDSSATGVTNLLAQGPVERRSISGLGDVWLTATTAGWALPGDDERWATLHLPPALVDDRDEILQRLSGPVTDAPTS